MKRKQDVWLMVILTGALMVLLLCLSGCQEQWGQGDPPTEWQATFGNDNLARLNFVQTKGFNEHQVILHGIDTKDPNGRPVRRTGVIEVLITLEERINQFESLNAQQHKKLGETVIGIHKRVEELEKVMEPSGIVLESDASPDIVICDKCGRASATEENELCICPGRKEPKPKTLEIGCSSVPDILFDDRP